ncbi:MAG: FeoA family protein [Lachnospiraceae bacterium]
MMPLAMTDIGKSCLIKKIGGNEKTKRFLESLGFVTGGEVTIISKNQGNLIVNVKETRVALSRELANKIMV